MSLNKKILFVHGQGITNIGHGHRFLKFSRAVTAWLPVLALIAALGMKPVFAAPPVVQLGATLTKVSDGTTPFPSIDPSGNNGLVATLDSAQYTFDVNVNTLDGNPHVVRNWTIVATLNSASSNVYWNLESLPTACGTKTLSTDGKTLTCVLSGTYNTGTTLNVNATWFASSGVPNGTNVNASFVTTAEMVADSSNGDHPVQASSGTSALTVVSESGSAEARKFAVSQNISRDSNGNPEYLNVTWGVQVEIKSPDAGRVKGVDSSGLGDLSLKDLATGVGNDSAFAAIGELVGCSPATSNGVMPMSVASSPRQAGATAGSGTWTCSQPSGVGGDIDILATGINWSPSWFPEGPQPSGASAKTWTYNAKDTPSDTYNSPAGQNNQAVVATQFIGMRYRFDDLIALDNTPADSNSSTNILRFCNSIGDVNVSGTSQPDDAANNRDCFLFYNISGVAAGKSFTGYGNYQQAPETEMGVSQGMLSNYDGDNYVGPGQKFAQQQMVTVNSSSIQGASDTRICDIIDTDKYNFIAYKPSATALTHGDQDWAGWTTQGTPQTGFSELTNADVKIQFSHAAIANFSDQRSVNCDSGTLDWVDDPTLVAGGINEANVVRVQVLKPISPGIIFRSYQSVKAKDNLSEGDRLLNVMHYDISNLTTGWQRPGASCNLDTSGTFGITAPRVGNTCDSLVDRAFVMVPTAEVVKTDNPNPGLDLMSSVNSGSNWTYNIQAGLGYTVDVPEIRGVKAYDVLPPGLDFVSSTLQPDLVVKDCNYLVNSSCLTDASARTNYGYTSIRWNRGDFTYSYHGTDNQPDRQRELFGKWQVTVRVGGYIPDGTQLQNKVWLVVDSGLHNFSELNFSTTTSKYDSANGPLDDDWVRATTAQSFSIEKSISEQHIPLNGTVGYNLNFGNLTGGPKTMDAIDILPHNGDGRTPASSIDGGYSVVRAEGAVNPGVIANVYITSADPGTLNHDPQDSSNASPGTGIWACTYNQAGAPGCPALNEITAIRIVSTNMAVGQYGIFRLELKTYGNDGDEYYSNNWFARATSMALPVESSTVYAQTPKPLVIGNLVFFDANGDGKKQESEPGIANVLLKLMDPGPDGIAGTADDFVYKETTTDSQGRWRFNAVIPGRYYVLIDPSNFEAGGSLYQRVHAPYADPDPDDWHDQNESHDLQFINGQYRTALFTVSYSNPTGEDSSDDMESDLFDNLTIDLAFISEPEYGSQSSRQNNLGAARDSTTKPLNLAVTGASQITALSVAAGVVVLASLVGIGLRVCRRS